MPTTFPSAASWTNEGLSNPGAANATVTVYSTADGEQGVQSGLHHGRQPVDIDNYTDKQQLKSLSFSSDFTDALPGNVVVASSAQRQYDMYSGYW